MISISTTHYDLLPVKVRALLQRWTVSAKQLERAILRYSQQFAHHQSFCDKVSSLYECRGQQMLFEQHIKSSHRSTA